MKLRSAWLLALALVTPVMSQAPAVTPPRPSGGPVEVGGIAATVNGLAITKTELFFMLAPMYGRLMAEYPHRGPQFEAEVTAAKNQVLDAMIDQKIMLSEFATLARNNGAKLPAHVIDEEIQRQIKENHGGDVERFREELRKSNIREDKFRDIVRDQLIVQAIRSEHFSDTPPPTQAEISKKYEQVKYQIRDVSQDRISFQKIYLPSVDRENPSATDADQLDLADKLMSDLRGGANFSELAKKYSRDSYRDQGGLAENQSRSTDLSPAFAAIIFRGKEGDLLGPIGEATGYTIVKIVKIWPGPTKPLSDPAEKELIENMIRREKTSAGYEKWIAEKRKTAMISKRA